MNSFLIHQEKTITKIYRENTLKELIDGIIARLQDIKESDLAMADNTDKEADLFFIYRILEKHFERKSLNI